MQPFTRHIAVRTLFGCCFLLAAAPSFAARPDVASVQVSSSAAASLVQAALDAEQAGDGARRSELLAKAIEADPDYAPARWHSGHVLFDGKWRSPEQVELLVAHQQRWVDYREFRDSLGSTAEDHQELARYCRQHGLEREERYHWANVLLEIPDHTEARRALGLVPYQGGLYVKDEVEDLEKQAKDATRRLRQELPHMAQLCRDVTQGTDEQRTAALASIESLRDPGVVDALQQAADKATKRSAEYAPELYGAIVGALSNIPQHEATLRLLKYAVYAETPSVRRRAAESLRTRPETDYVPLLMAALTAELDVETELGVLPDGTVTLTQTVTQQQPTAQQKDIRSVNYEAPNAPRIRGVDLPQIASGRTVARNASRASNLANSTQAQIAEINAESDALNRRIAAVLNVTSGTPLDAKPRVLWQQWQEFNELQFKISAETVNIYVTNLSEPSHYSCFAPGTVVWTQEGKRPIEEIVAGDLVLAQNPLTGELDYRPVLATTYGEPTKVMTLMVGNDRITATLGHRFWIAGRGWQMAKFLKPSAKLHSLKGPVMLEGVEPAEDLACHNLVVEGFHTYFVGESRLLVHDIECPRPALGALPGSATVRSLPTIDAPLAAAN